MFSLLLALSLPASAQSVEVFSATTCTPLPETYPGSGSGFPWCNVEVTTTDYTCDGLSLTPALEVVVSSATSGLAGTPYPSACVVNVSTGVVTNTMCDFTPVPGPVTCEVDCEAAGEALAGLGILANFETSLDALVLEALTTRCDAQDPAAFEAEMDVLAAYIAAAEQLDEDTEGQCPDVGAAVLAGIDVANEMTGLADIAFCYDDCPEFVAIEAAVLATAASAIAAGESVASDPDFCADEPGYLAKLAAQETDHGDALLALNANLANAQDAFCDALLNLSSNVPPECAATGTTGSPPAYCVEPPECAPAVEDCSDIGAVWTDASLGTVYEGWFGAAGTQICGMYMEWPSYEELVTDDEGETCYWQLIQESTAELLQAYSRSHPACAAP